MSIDFRTIREPSGDPTQRSINHLQRALSKKLTKDLVDQLDDSEDIYSNGQDIDSGIKFQTDLYSTHVFSFDKEYYPPIDAEYVTCWIRGRSMGSTIRDYSEYNNTGNINRGEPILVNGTPFDYFISDGNVGAPSTALRFNRPTSSGYNTECCNIPDNTNLQIAGLSTGFSIFIRIRLQSLEETDGRATTLYEKIDDSTPNNGFQLQVKTEGRLVAIIKYDGDVTAQQTGAGVIEPDIVYDIWLTYEIGDPTPNLKIYINNNEEVLSNFTGSVNWQEDLTNHDLWIMNRGYLTEGFTHGDLYDFMFYQKEKVVSDVEVNNHYTNKLSISAIPAGQILVANHWSVGTVIDQLRTIVTGIFRYNIAGGGSAFAGYTSTGFTSTGYTT